MFLGSNFKVVLSISYFFILPVLVTVGQSDERDQRIDQGRQFLEEREQAWLRCLNEAPLFCGKMSSRFQNRTTFEGWFSKEHVLRIYYSKEGNTKLILENPKYLAALTIEKSQKISLTHVSSATGSSSASTLVDMSTDSNGSFFPTSLGQKMIEIDDFHAQPGQQTIKFVPSKNGKKLFDSIELQFRDDTAPLPWADENV